MARTDTLGHFLTDVADAIREKKGTEETITASDFDTEIENLPSGGDLSEYFDDKIESGIVSTPGWTKVLKKLPDNLTVSGSNLSYAFYNYPKPTIPSLDTSNVTNMSFMFNACPNLKSIPLLDTSKVSNMSNIFSSTQIEDLPLLNTESATSMSNMFTSSNHLTDTSLDNVLQMCINATSYTGAKTLINLGFKKKYYAASRIQALPHYQDFIDAGWTIGWE